MDQQSKALHSTVLWPSCFNGAADEMAVLTGRWLYTNECAHLRVVAGVLRQDLGDAQQRLSKGGHAQLGAALHLLPRHLLQVIGRRHLPTQEDATSDAMSRQISHEWLHVCAMLPRGSSHKHNASAHATDWML